MLNKIPILQRLPTVTQLVPIYAFTFFLFNLWTMFHFFWRLPGWLYYLKISEILMILAYSLSTNLLESIIIVVGLAGLAAILPEKWFGKIFVPVSAAFIFLALGYLVFFLFQFYSQDEYPSLVVKSSPAVIVGMFFLASWLGRNRIARRILEAFADRTTTLLYLSLPLSVFSLIAVLIQNLF